MARGELTGAALLRYQQWLYDVRRREAYPTRMPSGPNIGELAERTGTRKPYVYRLAPAQIRADDRGVAVGLVVDKLAGKAADAITGTVSTVKTVAQAVADAPRSAASAVLGVPKWAVSALVIAGVAFVAYQFTRTAKG